MISEDLRNKRILIVDDVPQNIQVLAGILKEAGYQLGFAKDGKTALAHTDSTQFDLILLDIMMPEVDGYEVCSCLKSDQRKKDIPIIFITARDATADKTRGFELGAVDYITKPFDAREVLARVKTHLTIRTYALTLEQMVEERTRQLIHADRLATLGTFSAAIVHEVNNPLSYVIANARLLEEFWALAKPIMEKHLMEDQTGQLSKDVPDIQDNINLILDGCYRVSRLVKNLRVYSRKEGTKKEKYSLSELINGTLDLVKPKLKYSRVTVETAIPEELFIYCDQQKISQVLVNLINNACDAMEGSGGIIYIAAYSEDGRIDLRVKDNGPGIPPKFAEDIFDPFYTTKDKDKGTGLGLFIAKHIVEEHQGEILLSPFEGKGAEFRILFPSAASMSLSI